MVLPRRAAIFADSNKILLVRTLSSVTGVCAEMDGTDGKNECKVECGVHISKGSACLAAPLVEKGDHCIPIGDLVRNTNADCHSTAVKVVDLDC